MSTAHRDVVIHGVVAGAIGYVVVGLLFGVVDFLRAMYAVDLLWINLAAAAAVASDLVVRPRWPAARSAKPA